MTGKLFSLDVIWVPRKKFCFQKLFQARSTTFHPENERAEWLSFIITNVATPTAMDQITSELWCFYLFSILRIVSTLLKFPVINGFCKWKKNSSQFCTTVYKKINWEHKNDKDIKIVGEENINGGNRWKGFRTFMRASDKNSINKTLRRAFVARNKNLKDLKWRLELKLAAFLWFYLL